ncbi:MAG: hypothetical protein L6R38_001776 [Xanthoria sp. 2 TBL-2021]|nr:MAG: hypothetical protein L6R38_001776 [Xanthoria sp. 2 TBL-2021]
MATGQISLPLPVLPEGWSAPNDFKAIGALSTPNQRNLEPVGPHFLAHARRKRHKRTFSEDERIQAQENVKKVEDEDADDISEPEDPLMLGRDAKDWKGQDHYAVLGLSKHRYRATDSQIKRAHRKKVLRHHPDKRAATGSSEDDSFFKCIQKAFEVLTDPIKRRQFDSVDENANVDPPSKKAASKSPSAFYKLWGPVFEREARFSKTQPVPKLGNDRSSKEEVEEFYNFWFNFESWRSFEYQDEDVPDDTENRDQKRHVERKNNNARKKKKSEDIARLRQLVDDCLAGDERIKKFKKEARAGKDKKRLDREAEERRVVEEAKKAREEKEKLMKEKEEAEKAEKVEGKKAKEAAKNAAKKNKRVLKGSVKDANYLLPKGQEAGAKRVDEVLGDVEAVTGKLDNEELAVMAGKLTGLKLAEEVGAVWKEEVQRLEEEGKLKTGEMKTLGS